MMMVKVAVELIIAALAIWLLFYLGCKLFGVDDTERATLKNFELLGSQMDLLLNNPSDFASSTMTYYLADGYTLAAFDKNWHGTVPANPEKLHSRVDNKGPLLKPSECWEKGVEKACLCIYDGNIHEYNEDGTTDEGDPKENIIKCKVFEQNIVFVGHFFGTLQGSENGGQLRLDITDQNIYGKIIDDTAKYEYLQLYSGETQIDEWLPIGDVYIEKFAPKDSDNIYIFLTQYSKRSMNRYKYFGLPCPEGSSVACWTEDTAAEYGGTPLVTDAECIVTPAYEADFQKACDDVDGDKLCEVICFAECQDGLIEYPCICESDYRTFGMCKGGKYVGYDIDCEALDISCANYCKLGPAPEGAGSARCVGEEEELCTSNPCGFGGENGCRIEDGVCTD